MQNPPADRATHRRFAPTVLMLGNIATGCSVLAPAGMLAELSNGLDVSVRTAGLLITFGAIVLCVCSPLTALLTSAAAPSPMFFSAGLWRPRSGCR
jgi:DHA1 family inner membrane transport protein